jgi:cellobiose PTS system EIIB component
MAYYKVLLVCAAGMSSSLLEAKTIQAAKRHGHELDIHAVSVGEIAIFDFGTKQLDIILIAPQVRYKKKSLIQLTAPYGIRIEDIDPVTFGMVDGEKLFQKIMDSVPKEGI